MRVIMAMMDSLDIVLMVQDYSGERLVFQWLRIRRMLQGIDQNSHMLGDLSLLRLENMF
jgi:hypothetical protein